MPSFISNEEAVADAVESSNNITVISQAASARVRLVKNLVELGYFEPYITVASPFALFTVSGTPSGTNPKTLTMISGGITLTGEYELIDNGNDTVTLRLELTSDTTFTPGKCGWRLVQLNQWGGKSYNFNGGGATEIDDELTSSGSTIFADGAMTSLAFVSDSPFRFTLTPGSGTYKAGMSFYGVHFETRIGKDDGVEWASSATRTIDIVISDSQLVTGAADVTYTADEDRSAWGAYAMEINVDDDSILDLSGLRTSYDSNSYVTMSAGYPVINGTAWKPLGGNLAFSAVTPNSVAEAEELASQIAKVYSGDIVRFNNHDGLYASSQGLYQSSGGNTKTIPAAALTAFGRLMAALWAQGIRVWLDVYSYRPLVSGEVANYVAAGGDWGGGVSAQTKRSKIKQLAWVDDDVFDNILEAFFNLVDVAIPELGGSTLLAHPMFAGATLLNEPTVAGPNTSAYYVRGDTGMDALYDAFFGVTFDPFSDTSHAAAFAVQQAARLTEFRSAMTARGYGTDRPLNLLNWGGSGAQLEATVNQSIEEMHLYPKLETALTDVASNVHHTKKRWQNRYSEGGARLRKGRGLFYSEINQMYPSEARHELALLGPAYCAKQDVRMVALFDIRANRAYISSLTTPVYNNLTLHLDPIQREYAAFWAYLWRTGAISVADGERTILSTSAAEASYTDAIMDEWPFKVLRSTTSAGEAANTGSSTSGPYTGESDFGVGYGIGTAFADTPKYIAFSGEAKSAKTVGFAAISLTDPATVGIFSLDGLDLDESERFRITHLSNALWDGTTFAGFEKQSLTAAGSGNPVVKNAQASLVLTVTEPSTWTVYRILPDGTRSTEVAITVGASTITVPLSGVHGGAGWLHYEAVKTSSAAAAIKRRLPKRMKRLRPAAS